MFKKVTPENIAFFCSALIAALLCYCHAVVAPVVGEEMRYASIAWRMSIEHQWFIPQIGDHAYLHKPPLLFWLLIMSWKTCLHLPWTVIWPFLFAISCLYMTQRLTSFLFPEKKSIACLSPLVLVAMPFFINNVGIFRFDMLLTWSNLAACYCLFRSLSCRYYYWGFIFANAVGLLTKGPVIYLFTIPEAIFFAVYFCPSIGKYAAKYLFAIFLSSLSILIWWIPIILAGQSNLIVDMLTHQVLARATGNISVVKPIWDYLPLLPCIFLPWMAWAPFWTTKKINAYCLVVFCTCFVLLSLLKTKESRYLLPVIPFVAMMIAARLEMMSHSLSRRVCFLNILSIGLLLSIVSIGAYAILHTQLDKISIFYAPYLPNSLFFAIFGVGISAIIIGYFQLISPVFLLLSISVVVSAAIDLSTTYAISKTQNLEPSVLFLGHLLNEHVPIISEDSIVWDMQYAGRWEAWIPVMGRNDDQISWIKTHPNAWIVKQKKVDHLLRPYAHMENSCFEQTYSHMRAVLQICPVTAISHE